MPMNTWTEPGSPNGKNDWFTTYGPEVYADSDDISSTGTGYSAIGTWASSAAYSAQRTFVMMPSISGCSLVYTDLETAVSGLNRKDCWATVKFGTEWNRFLVCNTSQPPNWSSFRITDVLDNTFTSGYMPPNGYFKFTGLSAYTDTSVTDFHIRVFTVKADGRIIIQAINPYVYTDATAYGLTITSASFSDEFNITYYNRPIGSRAAVCILAGGVLTIPFKRGDIPANTNAISVVVENEAGLVRTTSLTRATPEAYPPAVDRFSVEQGEGQAVELLGNCLSDGSLQGVEVTRDRRVPNLHATFNATSGTQDGLAPTSGTGVTWGAGPFASSTGLVVGSTGFLDYASSYLNPTQGTVEMWYKPAFSATSTYTHSLFRFRTSGSASTNSVSLLATTGGVSLRVTDAVSATPSAQASISMVSGTWYHITGRWKFNHAGNSALQVDVRQKNAATGAQGALTGASIVFAVLPTRDLSSALEGSTSSNTMTFYDDVRIGNAWTPATSASASGTIADFRLSDVWTFADNSTASGFTGWTTSGVQFDGNNKMFRYSNASLSAGEINVLKFRPFTTWGTRKPSTEFNNSDIRPALIRGVYSGVAVGGGEYVERFRLIDAQGVFPDYTFPINPTNYNPESVEDNVVKQVSSIDGSRILSTYRLPARSTTMSWDSLTKVQTDEILDRIYSGNTFFLVDHNDSVCFGKMNLESLEEITAKVPSRYRLGLKFIGQGGRDDYSMD